MSLGDRHRNAVMLRAWQVVSLEALLTEHSFRECLHAADTQHPKSRNHFQPYLGPCKSSGVSIRVFNHLFYWTTALQSILLYQPLLCKAQWAP